MLILFVAAFLIPFANANPWLNSSSIESGEPQPFYNAFERVRFILFTRRNPTVGHVIRLNNVADLRASPFNPAHQTRITIHGWIGSAESGVNTRLRPAYLALGEFNCITVDWEEGADGQYSHVQPRVVAVGAVIGAFIDFLNLQTNVLFSRISIIGHSLGGHVAGLAGKRVTRGIVQSVVALDPALPLFHINNPAGRVHHTDAVHVQVIHTDIGRLGFDQPIGHASFYPNWGRLMPGCGNDLTGNCSHRMSWEFFEESLRRRGAFYGTHCAAGFPAIVNRQCPATGGTSVQMGGEPLTFSARGVFFLTTNEGMPRGQGWRQ